MIVRPVTSADLPALIELARSTGTGLTTLPANEQRLQHRVSWAEKAFAARPNAATPTTCSSSRTTPARSSASPPSPERWGFANPGTTTGSASP